MSDVVLADYLGRYLGNTDGVDIEADGTVLFASPLVNSRTLAVNWVNDWSRRIYPKIVEGDPRSIADFASALFSRFGQKGAGRFARALEAVDRELAREMAEDINAFDRAMAATNNG
jgi:hypothetical protein